MTARGPAVYIGLDLGTTRLKGIALTATGAAVAQASAPYPTHRPAPGAAEQAPADWLNAVAAVCGQLASATDPRRWRAVGLSAMLPTLVIAGPGGAVNGPAITWQDSRAGDWGAALRERCGGGALYRSTGQWVDGRYLLPMALRALGADRNLAAATAQLLAAKDYLFRWLTGEAATDPSTAAGFGCYDLGSGGWSAAVLATAAELAGDELPALPPIRPAATCLPLRSEAAGLFGGQRLPVCLGAADSVLGALGLGARRPGEVAYIAGTSNVMMAVSSRPLFDAGHRFLVTPLAEPGLWGLEMDLLAAGGAISWLSRLLGDGCGEADLLELASRSDPLAAPVVLPYLSPGEQGALWDASLRGTIVGLDLGHGREHLARGLVNGILMESRRCLAVLGEATGQPRSAIRLAGGGAAGSAFAADLADACRRPVIVPAGAESSHSARGAALLAALAADGLRPPDPPGAPVVAEPDQDRAARWDDLWGSHESARLAIARHYRGPAD